MITKNLIISFSKLNLVFTRKPNQQIYVGNLNLCELQSLKSPRIDVKMEIGRRFQLIKAHLHTHLLLVASRFN